MRRRSPSRRSRPRAPGHGLSLAGASLTGLHDGLQRWTLQVGIPGRQPRDRGAASARRLLILSLVALWLWARAVTARIVVPVSAGLGGRGACRGRSDEAGLVGARTSSARSRTRSTLPERGWPRRWGRSRATPTNCRAPAGDLTRASEATAEASGVPPRPRRWRRTRPQR